MKRSGDRILTTHVGSIVRPDTWCRRLIPGMITHHIIMVEHPRVIADRIVRFARIVGRENVIAASDCGFAQQETIARVHPKVMWAKFEALAAGARLATAELWGRAAA